jgi:hypothetical protein
VGFLTASVVMWHEVGNSGVLGDLAELWAGASANGVTMVRRVRWLGIGDGAQRFPSETVSKPQQVDIFKKNGSLLTKFPQKLQEQDQKEYKTRIWIPRS